MIRKNRYPLGFVFALLPLAVGCGGGGGMSELTLSEQNAQQVASQGIGAVAFLEQSAMIVDELSATLEPTAQVVEACDAGNAGVTLFDAAPEGELSAGDSATYTFQACQIDVSEGFTLTFNGLLSFTATDVTGTPPEPWSRTLSCSFDALSLGVGSATVVIDGGFSLTGAVDGSQTTTSVSGAHLSTYVQGGGQSFSLTIRDFALERTEDGETGAYTFTVDYSLTHSGLGGSIVCETVEAFTGNGDDDPSTGTLLVTGANGGTLTLVVLDGTNVRLLIDADGDGTDETTIDTTWAVLHGLE